MLTLTYGWLKPEDGDRGSVFWDALADDIVQMSTHDHDGVDSALIVSKNISYNNQSFAVSTLDGASGLYYADVTISGFTMGTLPTQFIITASSDAGDVGMIVYPSYTKLSPTVYRVTMIGSGFSLKALYG